MRAVRGLLVVALALGLAVVAEAGARGKGKGNKKGNKNHTAHGVIVVAVLRDKSAGTITIRVHNKKAGSQGVEKTFQVTPATRFQFVGGGKGQKTTTAATFAAVHKGERVAVRHNGNQAVDVRIHKGAKKQKQK